MITPPSFCRLCGHKLESAGENAWRCPGCSQTHFLNAVPGVELALLDGEGRVLLSERGREPNKGKYDLPGGFVDLNDTAESAVLREIHEELGLEEGDITELRYFTSAVMPYQFKNAVQQVLVSVFVADLRAEKAKLRAQDDVAAIRWVNLEEIQPVMFSSDQHYGYVRAILESQ